LAEKLEALMRVGAHLEFTIARPSAEKPRTGVLFVAPLLEPEQTAAATAAGFRKSGGIHALRIIGPDRPGLGAGMARTLGDAGINVSGMSAATIGERCVLYFRFGSDEDAKRAAQVLTPVLG